MTKSEKKALIEHLNSELKCYAVDMFDEDRETIVCFKSWAAEDVVKAIEGLAETPEKACMNYEVEYKRVCAEHEKLRAEADHWKHIADGTMERKRELETILNTLEFILGRKFEGG